MNKLDLAQQIANGADISLEKGELVLNVILKRIENTLVNAGRKSRGLTSSNHSLI